MSLNEDVSPKDSIDMYRDTPLRLLGYANEVGESFRAVVHVNVVRMSYVIASGYCLADTIDKTVKMSKESFTNENEKKKRIAFQAIDTLTWQGLASVVIPGFTINRICALSTYLLNEFTRIGKTRSRLSTIAIGLGCIPFIVKPIDHSVDFLLNNSLRKLILN